jgi:alpha-galactosidase/6-phospho-beta-glucosidase family protein
MKPLWESWPQWLIDAAVAAYRDGIHPATIGAVISRSEASVRSRLVREGVYISAASKRKMQIAQSAEGF